MYLVKRFSNVFFRRQNSTAAHEVTEEVALSWWVTCKAKATVAARVHRAGCLPGAGLSIPIITWDLFIPGHFWPLLPVSFLSLNNSLHLTCHPCSDVLTVGGKVRLESFGESSCSNLMD